MSLSEAFDPSARDDADTSPAKLGRRMRGVPRRRRLLRLEWRVPSHELARVLRHCLTGAKTGT